VIVYNKNASGYRIRFNVLISDQALLRDFIIAQAKAGVLSNLAYKALTTWDGGTSGFCECQITAISPIHGQIEREYQKIETDYAAR
jgi:hypothetical protein